MNTNNETTVVLNSDTTNAVLASGTKEGTVTKRRRGRPKGSKNKKTLASETLTASVVTIK